MEPMVLKPVQVGSLTVVLQLLCTCCTAHASTGGKVQVAIDRVQERAKQMQRVALERKANDETTRLEQF
jgi:hypothetical protein